MTTTVPDSGLRALIALAALHGVAADEAQLRHTFGADPFNSRTILLAADSLRLKARCVQPHPERLEKIPLPAIACERVSGRFFILAQWQKKPDQSLHLLIQFPGEAPSVVSLDELCTMWSGG